MDSNLIEGFAISYLSDEIRLTERLAPYISENDKEPSWDGNIYIYSNSSNFSKENIIGKVSVQVKGKQEKSKNLKKTKISYPVEIIDLKNYLKGGGVIFFVVLIDEENFRNRKIYYADLTPVKLKIELEKVKNQITKSIKFKEFPLDNQRKVSIFLNCYENIKKQISFSDIPLLAVDELNKNNIEEIVIPFISVNREMPQETLLHSDIYLYAKVKNSFILHPVKMLIDELEIHEEQKINISIDDKKYYTSIKVIRKEEKIKFLIGESFTITIEGNKIAKLNYKNSDKVRVLAKDLEFMLYQIEKGYFLFNEKKIEIDYKKMDFSNFNIEEQKRDLKKVKDIVKLLDKLNCSEDLNLSEIKQKGWIQLNYLIKAFVYNELIEGLKEPIISVKLFNIGHLKFIICIKKEKNGKYQLLDFFKEEFLVEIKTKNGKFFQISQYLLLKKEDLYLANNIKYNVLLSSFKKIKRYKETIGLINNFLLNLILAYDKTKKEDLILTAKEFSKWISSEFTEEELSYSIKILNNFQIIKRLRNLTEQEKEKIYEILEDKNINNEIRFGSYVLLGQKAIAKRYFEKLGEERKKEFINYPLYNLWKEL